MPDKENAEAPSKKIGLFELLASWDPLPEEDWLPEIDDPPPCPVTYFDTD